MKKLKDLALGVLINEGEDVMNVSPEMVGDIVDVDFNVGDNYIKFKFETPFGKATDLLVDLDSFKKWLEMNKGKFKDMFKHFVVDFMSNSAEGDASLNEMLDDDGISIIPDDGMPNNSTNSMVTSPKFDLEKIYKSFVPVIGVIVATVDPVSIPSTNNFNVFATPSNTPAI